MEVDKPNDTGKNDRDLLDSEDDSLPDIECDLCQKEFSNVKAYEQHLKGNKHFKMITKKKLMEKFGKMDISSAESNDGVVEDSTEEIICEICSKSCSGYIPYAAHLNSNTHFKNLKREKMKESMKDMPGVIDKNDPESDDGGILKKPFAQCNPCDKVFHDPEAFKKHLAGNSHKKKMLEVKTIESLRKETSQYAQTHDDDGNKVFPTCEVCNKSFSGPLPFKTHLHSTVHKKEVKRAEVAEELKNFFTRDPAGQKLICKQCSKPFTDPFALKIHLESNDHEKQKVKADIYNLVSQYSGIIAVKSIQNHSSDEESGENDEHRIGSNFFVCKLCHLSFTGSESVRDHVKSKKHILIERERKARKSLQKNLTEKGNEEKSYAINASKPDDSKMNLNGESHENVSTPQLFKTPDSDTGDFELI